MNLNGWDDGAWAEGSFVPESWGEGAPPEPPVVPPAVRRREGGTMYAPPKEMEQFARALRDEQDMMILVPMLAFIADQNRTLQ